MSWLARSIANSLKLEDDDEDENTLPNPNPNITDDDPGQSSSPRGVKEDISELTKTLSRQFWGVASFLAPPPPDSPPPSQISDDQPSDPEASNEDLISGIRSDFAEIGGRFKTGISKLSSNVAVSEITKIASNFLQIGSDTDGTAVGVTEEVVFFARDVAMHPETWLDFPVPDDDFDEFDMSDAQQEHALAVERLAPRLAALRIELCPGYMSEGCFWKIYFVLLHPRLSKEDAELLSTPQIVEARAMLSYELKNQNTGPKPGGTGSGTFGSQESADLPHEVSLSVPSSDYSEPVPSKKPVYEGPPVTASEKTPDYESIPSGSKDEIESEKHPIQSTEIQIVDKAVVEESSVNHYQNQHIPITTSKVLEEKYDDTDDWLKEEHSETVGTSGSAMPIENDEDVSFSDLEEDDDEDVPTSYKKVISISDASTKDSRDWVELSKSSGDSVKDVKSVNMKQTGQVSAHNSEPKESNDWLDVEDIDVM
ncbi:BSD domain-containing protein [Euphorbia peplus]|nr:BSD domain-containing protein [Euphorbia peplus]